MNHAAVFGADCLAIISGVLVGDDHCHAGERSRLLVRDASPDFGGALLRAMPMWR